MMSVCKRSLFTLASLLLMTLATSSGSASMATLPNPVLVFTRLEYYQANGKQWTRYKFRVDNLESYPNELFAAAPDLPPCGANKKSSRTWVDFYDSRGKRLYGFCAISNRDGLGDIWFSLETGEVAPSWVYIEMTDRQTNTKYKSNLAETAE